MNVLSAHNTRLSTVIAVIVVMLLVEVSTAQLVNSGHSLDANLELGSGGYNRSVGGSYLYHPRYTVASTRYGVVRNNSAGLYRSHNAFVRQRYSTTGYHGSRRYRTGHFPSRRYRY